jgi:two-component system NtrC family sensor kinase
MARAADGSMARAAGEDGQSPGAYPSDVRSVPPFPSELMTQFMDEAIVCYRPDGRISWVNDGFVRMTGYCLEEVVGAHRTDLIRGPFTRTSEFVQLGEDLAAQRDTALDFVTRTKSGASYWVSLRVRAVLEDGRVVGLVGVERDITPRRNAEERVRSTLRRAESLGVALRHEKYLLSMVLGTIPHFVWWKTAELRYLGANQAYLAFRGLSCVAEIVGRREGQLASSGGVGEILAGMEVAVLESRRPIADRSLTVADPGKTQRRFLVSVLPYLEHDELVGVVGIGVDISEVADLERQLAQANQLEAIGRLSAGIAHEINTPIQYVSDNTRFVADTCGDVLSSLGEIADLVSGQPPDLAWLQHQLRAILERLDLAFVAEEVPSALSQSLEGLDRVGGIVRAMKEFSHPGHDRSEVEINRVVETTVQVSRNEWKYVAELQLDLDPHVGVVPCIEGEVKQVLLNLVVNAAQAIAERNCRGDERFGRILVRTRRLQDDVVIAVQDDGIGMDEAVRQRVFDPFFTTKPVGQGTGQGLSLAYDSIVNRHGGRIEVVSAPRAGATFSVHLPLEVSPDPNGSEDVVETVDPLGQEKTAGSERSAS